MSLQTINILSHDFDDFSSMVQGFDLDFRPLKVPKSEIIRVSQSLSAQTFIGYAESSIRLRQHVMGPTDMRTIALLAPAHPLLYWCGKPVTRNQFLLFAADGEMGAISDAGFKTITVSFPQSWLDKLCSNKPAIADRIEKVLESESRILAQTWFHLSRWLGMVSDSTNGFGATGAQQDRIVKAALSVLFHGSGLMSLSCHQKRQTTILNEALSYIHSKKYKLRINELCRLIGTSERTLERIFHTYLGVTPKQYLTHYLMREVNHMLEFHGRELKVSDVAWHFGFQHLAQFSNDYRARPTDSLAKVKDCWFDGCTADSTHYMLNRVKVKSRK